MKRARPITPPAQRSRPTKDIYLGDDVVRLLLDHISPFVWPIVPYARQWATCTTRTQTDRGRLDMAPEGQIVRKFHEN